MEVPIVQCVTYEMPIKLTLPHKVQIFGNSPFRGNAPYGAIRRIFKMVFDRLIRLG